MSTPTPVRRQIVVPTDPADAFRIFTDEIGAWWPLDDKRSVHGPGGSVAFAGDRLVETSADGETSVWAEVLEWRPALSVRLAWHPGAAAENATEVRFFFAPVEQAGGGPATLVTLEHDGWERLADPWAARQEYESGWPIVLTEFGTAVLAEPAGDPGSSPEPPERAWLMLRHTVGPKVAGSIFAHPDFQWHAAFLGQLADEGVLVAAGPLELGDRAGAHGMTVLAVPPELQDEYRRRAGEEDQSVVRGLFQVEAVSWQVVMTGP